MLSSKSFLVWGFVLGKTCDPSEIKVYLFDPVKQGQVSFPTAPSQGYPVVPAPFVEIFLPILTTTFGSKKKKTHTKQ